MMKKMMIRSVYLLRFVRRSKRHFFCFYFMFFFAFIFFIYLFIFIFMFSFIWTIMCVLCTTPQTVLSATPLFAERLCFVSLALVHCTLLFASPLPVTST